MDDDAILTVVRRLARPHPSGGEVIERAVIIAEGADSAAIIARRGLHGSRLNDDPGAEPRTPVRYLLPAGALA